MKRTIEDFGDQWTRFQDIQGYYASIELLRDHLEPLISIDDLRGASIAEIGSGAGRVVKMLASAGAKKIYAIEPSKAFHVLKRNIAEYGDLVECLHSAGEDFALQHPVDLIFSIGVIHHIIKADNVIERCHSQLKENGKIFIWLYSKEGNRLYLILFKPLRVITKNLPDEFLLRIVDFLHGIVKFYIFLCTYINLPLKLYLENVYSKVSQNQQKVIIFDQLNPNYAKYYSRKEAIGLLKRTGFRNIRIEHRYGYSWSIVGTK